MSVDQCDISGWQRGLDLNAVAAAGVQSIVAKASEGTGYSDPTFGGFEGWLLGQDPNTGVIGGSYHFARPDLGNSAVAEADWYLSRHDARVFDANRPWIFSLDAESAGGSAAWCYSFLDRVSGQVGYDCWFYSYTSWISQRGVQAFNRPLWVAAPSSPKGQPPNMGWPSVTSHQYGYRNLGGQTIDADLVLTDYATLRKLAGVGGGTIDMTPEEHAWLMDVHTGMGAQVSVGPGLHPLAIETHDWAAQINAKVDALEKKVASLSVSGGTVDVHTLAKAIVDEIGVRVKPA